MAGRAGGLTWTPSPTAPYFGLRTLMPRCSDTRGGAGAPGRKLGGSTRRPSRSSAGSSFVRVRRTAAAASSSVLSRARSWPQRRTASQSSRAASGSAGRWRQPEAQVPSGTPSPATPPHQSEKRSWKGHAVHCSPSTLTPRPSAMPTWHSTHGPPSAPPLRAYCVCPCASMAPHLRAQRQIQGPLELAAWRLIVTARSRRHEREQGVRELLCG